MGQMPQASDSGESLVDRMHQAALQNGGHMNISKFKQAEDHSQNWIKTKKKLQNKNPNAGILTDAYTRTELSRISYVQLCERRIYFSCSFFKM